MSKTVLIGCLLFVSYGLFAQRTVAKIDSLLKAYIALNKFNGTVLVSERATVIFNKGYGYADNSEKNAFSAKSVFQIGSLSKSFTSLLILKLFNDKGISIDEPVSKFVDNCSFGKEVTIRHLLTHTSGIYEPLNDPEYFNQLTSNNRLSNKERNSYFKDKPLAFTPGTKFSYSNSGYNLLGSIIEIISGMTYEDCLRKYIFEPFKMRHSGFDFRAVSVNKRKVVGYSYLSKTKQIKAGSWNPYALFSSGALYSTTDDLLKFYNGLKTYKLVSKENFQTAITPYLNGYGLGWYIDSIGADRIVNHGGNIDGFSSYYLMNLQNDICIIILSNITTTSLERIGNSIYKIVTNKPYTLPKPKSEITVNKDHLAAYVGKYEISENQFATISLEGDYLFLQLNKELKYKLYPEKNNLFFVKEEDFEIEFLSFNDKALQIKIRQGLSTKVGDKLN